MRQSKKRSRRKRFKYNEWKEFMEANIKANNSLSNALLKKPSNEIYPIT